MIFTWDDAKYESNLIKHGFDFTDAEIVFVAPPLPTKTIGWIMVSSV